jgi:hypothetical protein
MQDTGSDNKVLSKVLIFASTGMIRGSVSHEPGQRLLDLLNLAPGHADIHGADFFCVNGASVKEEPGHDPQQPIYVNKAHILCVAEEEIEGWKRTPDVLYPFVTKEAVGIKFYVPAYTLTGKIHYPRGHKPQEVLTARLRFFPLTEAHIHSVAGGEDISVPFIAVNKDQILYIESIN